MSVKEHMATAGAVFAGILGAAAVCALIFRGRANEFIDARIKERFGSQSSGWDTKRREWDQQGARLTRVEGRLDGMEREVKDLRDTIGKGLADLAAEVRRFADKQEETAQAVAAQGAVLKLIADGFAEVRKSR